MSRFRSRLRFRFTARSIVTALLAAAVGFGGARTSLQAAAAEAERRAAKPVVVSPAAVNNVTLDRAITAEKIVRNKRVVLENWAGKLADMKIEDLSGRDISALLAARTEASGVTLAQTTEPFVMKPRLIPTIGFASGKETELPGGMVDPSALKATGTGPVKAAWFRLVCSASPRPAPWNESARKYETTLKFSVRYLGEGELATPKLRQPITVSIDFEGLTGTPLAPIVLEEVGLEFQKTLPLQFTPSSTQPKLLIRSTLSDADVLVEALPRLELRPARTTVLGFGLDTVNITVAQLLASGEPAKLNAASAVDVQVKGSARREGGDVSIPAGEARTEFVVRSSGLGRVTIQATAGTLSATTEIAQRFPFGPLIAALLGGALGGFSRRWMKNAPRRAEWRNATEGLVVGLVAFVAAVLGVGYLNLPPAIAATEAGAFLTGVLCGFAGVAIFGAMTKKLGADGEK